MAEPIRSRARRVSGSPCKYRQTGIKPGDPVTYPKWAARAYKTISGLAMKLLRCFLLRQEPIVRIVLQLSAGNPHYRGVKRINQAWLRDVSLYLVEKIAGLSLLLPVLQRMIRNKLISQVKSAGLRKCFWRDFATWLLLPLKSNNTPEQLCSESISSLHGNQLRKSPRADHASAARVDRRFLVCKGWAELVPGGSTQSVQLLPSQYPFQSSCK